MNENVLFPQVIQDVEEFVSSSDLDKYSITLLAHQWILCSEWVPSEWVQTADKNITVIHMVVFDILVFFTLNWQF